ncbi:hypothetical protein C7I85_07850 [Mesorhizobium soli]|uniref:Uncharacterized protein n=2 Tax=Pseudaminobacter soli (ex Li et al. 2025) TaxID=1295366 RepID=A0A2P7SIB0_9HYPH|nr:hypothetical protein C7I85_07850 [Mesorhizobium soli]
MADGAFLSRTEKTMARLTIEKFIDGKRETAFTMPAFVLGLARAIMPKSALASLESQGLDLPGLLEAKRAGKPCTKSFHVSEKGVSKKIVVSLA